MCTVANGCDCTWGCTDTVRESALKVDCGRKIPFHTGNQTFVSGVLVDALPTELHSHTGGLTVTSQDKALMNLSVMMACAG